MLNTSIHNKSARASGILTYEKFLNILNTAISKENMPDSNLLKVDFVRRISFLISCLEYL